MTSDTAGPLASIVVPTLNRHRALARALASAMAQEGLAAGAYEIVVVDNSPDANARAIVAGLAAQSRVAVRYVSRTRPGVATARNAGIAAARGCFVAFLDDDEEASPVWLASLLGTAERTGADAVFGPVAARAEDGREIGALGAFFTRRVAAATDADVTRLHPFLGTNNSLFSRARCLAGAAPFDERLDRTGGEDSLLLARLVRGGARFAWCDEARVTEWVPPTRTTWDYVRRRTFLSGQVRTFVHAMSDPPRHGAVALWMGIGAAQFALCGAASLLLRPLDATRAAALAARARGGLGKLLWTERFRAGLYATGFVSHAR